MSRSRTLPPIDILALTSDRALKRLGPQRWKSLQRWTYALALLTVFHGAAYQIAAKREKARARTL